MTVRIGKTALRVQPLLPIVWLAALFSGNLSGTAGCACALMLHELGHLLAARYLGVSILEIELSPIGGLIAVEDPEALSASRGAILSAAGPLFSLGGCYLAAFCAHSGMDMAFCQALARSSLLLCLFNLLPALPLDGGCILRYLLSPIASWGVLSRWLLWIGRAAAVCLCALSVYFTLRGEIVLSPMLAGLYLLYAAEMERKQAVGRYVTSLIARRQKINENRALPVDILAVSAAMPARRLLPQLRPGRYHLLQVVSPDGMELIGALNEKELCELIMDHTGGTIADYMKKRPAQR